MRERTAEKNGYSAMVLGADALKKSRIKKPYAGQFPEGTDPTRFLLEFKDFEKECKVGDKLGVEIFEGVRFVDVRGTTKGKGFQGVVTPAQVRRAVRVPTDPKFHREMGSVGTGALPQDRQGLEDARAAWATSADRAEPAALPRGQGKGPAADQRAPSPAGAAAWSSCSRPRRSRAATMKTQVYGLDGNALREIELADEVFGREVSEGSIYHAIRNELANKRLGRRRSRTAARCTAATRSPGNRRARAAHARGRGAPPSGWAAERSSGPGRATTATSCRAR